MTATPLRCFFIVGSPRSGTTLLQTMLMQSPGVTIPPETHFISLTYDRRGVHGPITSDAGWKRATDAIAARNDIAEFPVRTDALRERLNRPGERSYTRMLQDWLSLCAEQAGAGVVGEKSPAHTAHLRMLADWMPESKFVHIVRDPRDVALSHAEVWGRTTLQASLRWRLDQRLVRRARHTLDHRILTVRYEDLVADPEPSIRSAAKFLGIGFIAEMTDPSRRKTAGFAAYETHKQQTLEKVTTSRIHRYKQKLAKRDIRIIQALCSKDMKRIGYALDPASTALGFASAATDVPRLIADHARRLAGIRRNAGQRSSDKSY